MSGLPELTNNVATFVSWGFTGTSHYRSASVARALGEGLFVRDDHDLKVIIDIGIRNAPVMVMTNPWQAFQIRECEMILEAGGRLIIDVDDDLRAVMGKTDLLADFDEDTVKRWEENLTKATLVTTSTQWIADRLTRDLGIECVVCPNGIDLDRFNVRKFPRPKEATVIGWSGGVGHLDALKQIAPAINRVMDARPNTVFVSLGAPAPEVLPSSLLDQKHDKRFHDAGFLPLYQHAVAMCQFHIGLAPAMDTDFYRSKSPIRAFEQAAAYTSTISQSPTYDGLKLERTHLPVDADTDAWVDAILDLVDNPKERYMRTKRAYRELKNNYTTQHTLDAWRTAIQKALDA